MSERGYDPYNESIPDLTLQHRWTPTELRGVTGALDPGGIGAYLLPSVLSRSQIFSLAAEIFDPFSVPWRDNHTVIRNRRGQVDQRHDVFALKASRGDERWLARVPRLRQLAANLQDHIRELRSVYPTLADWSVDELSMHRYDDPEVGLSWHKDQSAFRGVIGLLTLEGEGDLMVQDQRGAEHALAVKAGDFVLLRATGLYAAPDTDGTLTNLCPDHGAYNQRTPFRTTFIIRDIVDPEFRIKGFSFENWP